MIQTTSDGWNIKRINVPKDPDSVIDYGFDWSEWLASGETITTSTWPTISGLANVSDSNTTTATSIFLSGGTTGESYLVTNRIVTNQGRTEDRSFYIYCLDK